MEFEQLQWLLPLAITLHMLEEAIWLPAWSRRAGPWHVPVGAAEFGFASAVLVALAYLVTYSSIRSGRESLGVYLMAGLATVMLVNAAIPHLGAAIQQRAYAPGLATGVLLNLPVSLIVLGRAFASGYISTVRFALAAGLWLIVAAVVWPRLFGLGRRVIGLFGRPA